MEGMGGRWGGTPTRTPKKKMLFPDGQSQSQSQSELLLRLLPAHPAEHLRSEDRDLIRKPFGLATTLRLDSVLREPCGGGAYGPH